MYKSEMVRATKTEKTTTTTTTPVAKETTTVKEAAPKKEKTTKKTTATTTTETVVTPVVAAPVTNEVVSSDESSTVNQKMNEFGAKLQQLNSIFAAVKGDFKTLEKVISRELKSAQKSSTKRAKRAGNRQPSGFVKPTKISAELAAFLGKSNGTEMARTAVSKEINNYIRTHQLQDKAHGRKINPDARLSALLNIKPDEELTYFNLQRFMKHHFIKAEVVATA
jgi:chromatin remodeling complex protein RSC6